MTQNYRYNQHDNQIRDWCPWSGQPAADGDGTCPSRCPDSDVEVNPYADDQRYDPTLPDPAAVDDARWSGEVNSNWPSTR
jgi:hypothetical protein